MGLENVSKGTGVDKSKECMICRYWLFNDEFKYQDSVCNGCYDLLIYWFLENPALDDRGYI